MKRNLNLTGLLITALWCSAVLPVTALQFTNVTTTNVLAPLSGVAYNDSETFVSVAGDGTVLASAFVNNQAWVPSGGYQTNAGASSLTAVTFGGGLFVAGAPSASIFVSSDSGQNWGPSADPAFATPTIVEGLAYNLSALPSVGESPAAADISVDVGGGVFAAAASIFELSHSSSPANQWDFGQLENPTPSFLESFRDVTAWTSGFAACGIRGLVRLSTDAGVTWTGSRPLTTSEPDLFGIAWNGGNTLVTVGAGGRLIYSLNNGTNWVVGSSGTGANLNAVAFTGDEFVAFGDGGTIIVSVDGVNWNAVTNVNVVASLRGAAAGRTGQMNGVLMAVGDSGTIVLAGNQPPSPVKMLDATNCAQSLPNPPLVVAPQISGEFPAGTMTADWYAAAAGGIPVATGTFNYSPLDQLAAGPGAPSNYTYYAEARDLRTGFTSTNRTAVTLTINPRPTATVSGTNTICNGESTLIQAVLTGIAPWTVTWSDGFVQTTNASPATRLVSPTNALANAATNVLYTVTVVSNATSCVGNQPGDLIGGALITVNPRPTAVVSGTNTICNGESTLIQAALTGIAPWTVTWSDGFVQTTNASPATRLVSPTNALANTTTNILYTVTAVSNATTCAANPGELSGGALITVNPRPTAVVSGTNTICNGESTLIQAVLTGIAPWTVTWSDGFVQATNASPATRLVSPTNALANAATNVLYTVTAVSNATTCAASPGDLSGGALITVNPRPTAVVSGDTNIVAGGSAVIQAVLTGLAPWTVTWSDGVVSTNVASSPLQRTVSPVVTTVYIVTNVLSAGCDALGGDLSGSATVTVSSASLSISPDGTNVVVEWFGNLTLESATNLTPPVTWFFLTNGMAGGTNRWTNSVIPPPDDQFFRLVFTNSP